MRSCGKRSRAVDHGSIASDAPLEKPPSDGDGDRLHRTPLLRLLPAATTDGDGDPPPSSATVSVYDPPPTSTSTTCFGHRPCNPTSWAVVEVVHMW
ncbi:hypothetical protein QJS10_CPB22g00853 [Acorus calamus]|uniref:Uncharacterized protein n=1 Tax=Acorus calamus TaxID=4465 RepID=A0AAV9C1N8_ACOCL|nr:hypothetical protein QJS10_CPB22g00853 [Acorus calamus]